MSLQARFTNLMTQKGAIKAFVKFSTGGQGAPVFSTGAATTYQMHFTFEKKAVWGKDTMLLVNQPIAYLATTATIDPRSRLVFAGTTYRIESVHQVFDNINVHHVKLLLVGG